jgi:hypothetical protein
MSGPWEVATFVEDVLVRQVVEKQTPVVALVPQEVLTQEGGELRQTNLEGGWRRG